MSHRVRCLILALLVACGGSQVDSKEPQTAKEKQLQDAKAKGDPVDPPGKHWGGWKYQGDREDCFYVVGRKCFRSKKVACGAAKCPMAQCKTVGGGPASVECKKKG